MSPHSTPSVVQVTLPFDIWVKIIPLAFQVPGALIRGGPPDAFEGYASADAVEIHRKIIISTRTKYSLLLVSRTFYDISRTHLFDIVCLTSVHQLTALRNLLEQSKEHRSLVQNRTRRVDLAIQAPPLPSSIDFEELNEDVRRVLKCCINLAQQGFFQDIWWDYEGRIPDSLMPFKKFLQCFHCRNSSPGALRWVLMPMLHTLHIELDRAVHVFGLSTLPTLETLVLYEGDLQEPRSYVRSLDYLHAFVSRHGSRLTSMTVQRTGVDGLYGGLIFMGLAESCPRLKHLVVDIRSLVDPGFVLLGEPVQSVERLGLAFTAALVTEGYFPRKQDWANILMRLVKHAHYRRPVFPSLTRIRLLSREIRLNLCNTYPDVARLCIRLSAEMGVRLEGEDGSLLEVDGDGDKGVWKPDWAASDLDLDNLWPKV